MALQRINRQPWIVRKEAIIASPGVPFLEEFTRNKKVNLFRKARNSLPPQTVRDPRGRAAEA